jgi:hypothetical protein
MTTKGWIIQAIVYTAAALLWTEDAGLHRIAAAVLWGWWMVAALVPFARLDRRQRRATHVAALWFIPLAINALYLGWTCLGIAWIAVIASYFIFLPPTEDSLE